MNHYYPPIDRPNINSVQELWRLWRPWDSGMRHVRWDVWNPGCHSEDHQATATAGKHNNSRHQLGFSMLYLDITCFSYQHDHSLGHSWVNPYSKLELTHPRPALPCPVCRGTGLIHDNLEAWLLSWYLILILDMTQRWLTIITVTACTVTAVY